MDITKLRGQKPKLAMVFFAFVLGLVTPHPSRLLVGAISVETPYEYDAPTFPVHEHIFHATVDHFSFRPTTPKTFPLRYYVNKDYYNRHNKTSPCFFYAGNEADIRQFVNNSGFLFEAAEEFGALVVFAEHRYYGESLIPDNDDMSFLTVEQAMEDFNTLNVHIRNKWKMHSQGAFVVFGGSYGGNLALWLRLKNPNLWAGAIASSATPLKTLLRTTNGFARIETQVYANVSSQCPDLVRQGWRELFQLADSSKGRQTIQHKFALCEPLPDPTAAEDVHGWVGGALETLVQYGYPYPTNFYNPVPAYPFRVACQRMLSTNTGLDALRAAVDVFYNYTGQAGPCFDYDDDVTFQARRHWEHRGDRTSLFRQMQRITSQKRSRVRSSSNLADPGDTDAWGYQTCTEVYQPMPTDGVTDFEVPYTPDKTEYYQSCWEAYQVEPRPDWEEMTFMGSDIGTGSNIFLTHGQLDPWRAAGIQQMPRGGSDSITIRTIENGAHHLDLRAAHPMDPPSVISVRAEERAAMREWIIEWSKIHAPLHAHSPHAVRPRIG